MTTVPAVSRLRSRQGMKYVWVLVIVVIIAVAAIALPVGLLQSTVRTATPYVLGALAAVVASRAGVLNLAIEGKMLFGAFIAVAVLYRTGLDPLVGVFAATVAGGILGSIFAVLYLKVRINLVILALAVNLFIANFTVYILRVSYGAFGTLADPSINGLPTINIPIVQDIPVIGPLLSGYNAVVYIGWIMVFVIHLVLYRTQFGRHIRAVGENKAAAESVGINVTRVQVFALTLSGMLAGLAGSFLSLGVLSQFLENMTNGRGWIAITVSLFAFERPIPAFLTALFFGFSEAFSFYLQSRPGNTLPPDLLLMVPQLFTLGALVLVALRIRGGELLKRRSFAAQFSRELDDLRQGKFVHQEDPPATTDSV